MFREFGLLAGTVMRVAHRAKLKLLHRRQVRFDYPFVGLPSSAFRDPLRVEGPKLFLERLRNRSFRGCLGGLFRGFFCTHRRAYLLGIAVRIRCAWWCAGGTHRRAYPYDRDVAKLA